MHRFCNRGVQKNAKKTLYSDICGLVGERRNLEPHLLMKLFDTEKSVNMNHCEILISGKYLQFSDCKFCNFLNGGR